MKIKDIKRKTNEENLALCEVLNIKIPELITLKDQEITKKTYKKYAKIVKKLKKGLPLAYILKKAYFLDKEYYVNKNVLIPRPETEILVEKTKKLIKSNFQNNNISILDIGTGSGVIAISLNKMNNKYQVFATDISKKALKVAKKNQKKHNTNIKFINTDLYSGINEKFDVIISNPPYVENNSQTIEDKVKKNEPHIALFGGKKGLDYYERILKNINSIIKEKHIIAFEIDEKQAQSIEKQAKKYLPSDKIIIEKDLNGYDRYIFLISK